jgi:raffinose/stachyose/melibiose transport system permease protein
MGIYKMKKKYYSYIYLIPGIGLYVLMFLLPALVGICLAFTNWTSYNKTIDFIGLTNFNNFFKSVIKNGINSREGAALINPFIIAFIAITIQNGLALGLALLFNGKHRMSNFARSAFFLPSTLSLLISGYSFSAILSSGGPFDQLLKFLGMDWAIKGWLTDKWICILTVAFVNTWIWLGFTAAIYLAGLKAIPAEMYEAADIDGAGKWNKFKYVILPLLGPSITTNVILTLVGSMKMFDLVYIMIGQSFDYAFTMNTLVYYWKNETQGYASAISVVLFIIVVLMAIPILRKLRSREVQL